MSADEQKQLIRHSMLKKRCKMDKEEIEDKSATIADRAINLPITAQAKIIGIYLPMGAEVNTRKLALALEKAGKQLCVPLLKNKAYSWGHYRTTQALKKNRDCVDQPIDHQLADPAELDLIFVPGVAFTSQGDRIGRGGGHYDRLLKTSKAIHVGLAFTFQLVDTLPREPHDIPIHVVITETGTFGQLKDKPFSGKESIE